MTFRDLAKLLNVSKEKNPQNSEENTNNEKAFFFFL